MAWYCSRVIGTGPNVTQITTNTSCGGFSTAGPYPPTRATLVTTSAGGGPARSSPRTAR
jgi:hypothetical protein